MTRTKQGLAALGAVGLAAAQLAVFGGTAHAAPPSAVWIQGGTLNVLSPAGQVNFVFLTPAPGQVFVRDTVGNLAAQFPCVPVDAHTVRCPQPQINFFVVNTNDGNDRITNQTALPGRIVAGAGNDLVSDGPGNQGVDLGPGTDFAGVGFGRDTIIGGPGVDTASYSTRAVAVSLRLDNAANDGQAGEQDNILVDVENGIGGSGPDTIIGSNLNNQLRGLNGNDFISGSGGTDLVDGGFGADQMFGGAGIDTVSYAGRAANVQVRLDNLANDGQGGEGDNARPDNENVIGGNGNDLLVGSNLNNALRGLNGNDSLHGLGGNDSLLGDAGNDLANGGANVDACVAEIEASCEI